MSRTRFWFNLILGVPAFLFLGLVAYSVANYQHLNRDNFAEKLVVPANLEYDLPRAWPPRGNAKDEFQDSIKEAVANQEDSSGEVNVDLANLESTIADHPALLERFLATHQGWRFTGEGFSKHAERRRVQNGFWLSPLLGHHPYLYRDGEGKFLTSLRLSWNQRIPKHSPPPTVAKHGDLIAPVLHSSSWRPNYSACRFQVGQSMQLQIAEASSFKNRAATQSSVDFINNELSVFAGDIEWEDLLPVLSSHFHEGPESFEIYQEAYEPSLTREEGSYTMCLWVNPGESGSVYLKAFEVTQNHPLSAIQLHYETIERIGWSDNVDEKFFANSTFSIHEGESGQPYAARFEVWFVPASGKPERKLMEKVILIEGADQTRG